MVVAFETAQDFKSLTRAHCSYWTILVGIHIFKRAKCAMEVGGRN